MFRNGVAAGLCLASVCSASPARASGKQGAAQISLDGSLLKYQTLKLKQNNGNLLNGGEEASSTTSYGPAGAGLGFGLGYAVSDLVVLGLRTSFSPTGSLSNEVAVLPRLELMFDTGASAVFLAAMAGIGSSTTNYPPSGTGLANFQRSRTTFLMGGSAGVHVFVSDTFSFDPAFTVLGFTGSQTEKIPGSGQPDPTIDVSGIQVMVTAGLSAWIGGRPTPAPLPYGASAPVGEGAVAPEESEAPVARGIGEIKLPHNRVLRVKLPKNPDRPWVSINVSEPGDEWDLVGCADISVTESGQALKLKERNRAESGPRHSVTGFLPTHALELLATTEATLDVCSNHWPLSPESRAAIRAFLDRGQPTPAPKEPAPSEVPSAPAEAPTVPTEAFPPSPPAAPITPTAPTHGTQGT